MLRTFILCLLLATLISVTPCRGDDDPVSLYFLDVGQGDALLVHQPGSCAALVDAGPPSSGPGITATLEKLQIDALDLVIITHPHLDHIGGLFEIVPRIPISRLYNNGATNQPWNHLERSYLLQAGLTPERLRRGNELACGPVTFEVLYPDQRIDFGEDLNSGSLAMLITLGTTRLLHMGDLAGPGAVAFLRSHDVPAADILKVAHHGASDAAPPELLDRVSPDYAIISTATENRIGSPAQEVLARLAAAGINVLRTDRDGSLHFVVDQSGYRLQSP